MKGAAMKFDLSDVPEREVLPGFRGRFIHTDSMALTYWNIDTDCGIPAHAHPHEQVVNMLEGELELTVAGVRHVLRPGQVFVIPGNVEHSARALTPVRVLDVFTPVREDYRQAPAP
jgi:quercetin dioxygenase-like cupin family protein